MFGGSSSSGTFSRFICGAGVSYSTTYSRISFGLTTGSFHFLSFVFTFVLADDDIDMPFFFGTFSFTIMFVDNAGMSASTISSTASKSSVFSTRIVLYHLTGFPISAGPWTSSTSSTTNFVWFVSLHSTKIPIESAALIEALSMLNAVAVTV